MNSCDDFIEKAKKNLPDLCSVKDLIALGIYRSEQAAAYARKKSIGPDFFKLPHRTVIYPKIGVINYLTKMKFPSKVLERLSK